MLRNFLTLEREKLKTVASTLPVIREGMQTFTEAYGELLAFVGEISAELPEFSTEYPNVGHYIESGRDWLIHIKQSLVSLDALLESLEDGDTEWIQKRLEGGKPDA